MNAHFHARRRRARQHAILAAAAFVIAPLAVRADDYNWKTNIPSGDWSLGSNWSDNDGPGIGPPSYGDFAYIGHFNTVTVSNSQGADGLYLGYTYNGAISNSSAGTLSVLSTGSLSINTDLYASSGSLVNIAGNGGISLNGYVIEDSGSNINVNGYLQNANQYNLIEVGVNSAATFSVGSAGLVVTNGLDISQGGSVYVNGGQFSASSGGSNNTLQVGYVGTGGLLNVNSGGELDCIGLDVNNGAGVVVNTSADLKIYGGQPLDVSSGCSVTVENSGQLENDAGQFDISGNMTVETSGRAFADELTLDNGSSMTLDGQGSMVSVNLLAAFGNATVQNAGQLADTQAVVANNATVTVTGALSTWTSGGSLSVGYPGYGDGNVSVTNGAVSSVTGSIIADYDSSITLGGTGAYGGDASVTSGGNLYIGYTTYASVNVQSGGDLSDLSGFVGYLPGSSGSIIVKGSNAIWSNSQGLFINTNGTLSAKNGASVTAAFGSAATGASIQVVTGSTLAISGAFANSAAISDGATAIFGSLTGNGTVSVGGTLAFNPSSVGSLANIISGTGALLMSGSGSLIVSSANPSFTGQTNIESGILQLTSSSSIGTSAVALGGAGTLDLNGNNLTVSSLSGGGVIDDLSAGGSLTLTVSGTANSTFYGDIRDTTGAVSLTKSGGETLALIGIDTYSGTTTVNSANALALDSTGALPVGGAIVNNGSLFVNAATVAGHVTGSGTTTVAPGVSFFTDFTQGALVNNGTTSVEGASSAGSVTGAGTLIVAAGSSMALTANTINSVAALSLGSGATLDIAGGSLQVNYGSSADPIAAIVANLSSGFAGGAWTGTGIVSSTAAAAHGTSPTVSVGYADGNSDNATLASANQIVIKYTLAGDANLDGRVNFTDFSILIANYGKTGTDWAHGNFAYGPGTNFTDFSKIIANYGQTLPPVGGAAELPDGNVISLAASARLLSPGIGQLPEPSALCLLAVGAARLVTRRRRNRDATAN